LEELKGVVKGRVVSSREEVDGALMDMRRILVDLDKHHVGGKSRWVGGDGTAAAAAIVVVKVVALTRWSFTLFLDGLDRHLAAADMLLLYCHTDSFVRPYHYDDVISPPIEVCAR